MAVVADRAGASKRELGCGGNGGQVSILTLLVSVGRLADVAPSDVLRSEPNSPDVLTLRGLIMFLSAKTAQALSHVQSALRLDPGHEPAQRLRKRVKDVDRLKEEGNVAFKAGRLEEATEKYSEAIDVRVLPCIDDNYVIFVYSG